MRINNSWAKRCAQEGRSCTSMVGGGKRMGLAGKPLPRKAARTITHVDVLALYTVFGAKSTDCGGKLPVAVNATPWFSHVTRSTLE